MDKAVLDRLRAQLEQERDELHTQLLDLGINPESGAPINQDAEHGFADSGQATAEKARLLSVAEALLDTSHEVTAALKRMGNGKYGICESCGKQIPIERLDARPFVRLCVACKQRAG